MSKEKEIGELFRESLNGYQAEPPAGLWESIAQDKALLKFNRRRKMARIAKFTAVPFVATVAIVIALLVTTGKNDNTLAVSPEQSTNITSVTIPSPAPIPSVENTQLVTSTPHHPHTPNGIIVPPSSDNQKETIEEISASEPVTAVVEVPASTSKATGDVATDTRQEKPEMKTFFINEEGAYLTKTPPQPQPKSDRSGQLTYSKDTSVCRNSQLTLFVHNAMDVHWNVGVQGESITICPDEPVLISATITTYDKVDTTIYIHVGVFNCGLWIPTAFTPNGDGLNDEFLVQAPADITHYECTIYDRSRGLLFRTSNIRQGWDGTANGKPLPFGTYFYIITYRDEAGVKHVEKGQITLIR